MRRGSLGIWRRHIGRCGRRISAAAPRASAEDSQAHPFGCQPGGRANRPYMAYRAADASEIQTGRSDSEPVPATAEALDDTYVDLIRRMAPVAQSEPIPPAA